MRESMQYLVSKVRTNVGDITASKQFTDDQIQDFLDARRRDIAYVSLIARKYRTQTSYLYKRFYADSVPGYWETDAEVVDGLYNVLTPDTFDAINGVWTFNAGLLSPTIYASGAIFDVNAASADLLEAWFSAVKREFTFSRGQRSFQRGEQLETFKQSIDLFRSRSWITVTPFVRTDY